MAHPVVDAQVPALSLTSQRAPVEAVISEFLTLVLWLVPVLVLWSAVFLLNISVGGEWIFADNIPSLKYAVPSFGFWQFSQQYHLHYCSCLSFYKFGLMHLIHRHVCFGQIPPRNFALYRWRRQHTAVIHLPTLDQNLPPR